MTTLNSMDNARDRVREEQAMVEQEESHESVSLAEVIPVQYSDPVAVRIQSSGEYRLLWAVLEDTIDCYFRYAGHTSAQGQELFREAEEWIESDEEEWLCSFIGICRAFQIEPTYLRRGLRRRLEAMRAGRQVAPLQRAA
ncbi:MAG: hypothetical protein HYZ72_06850 [Deltaproteobacteria bacterium]|nr:hypothetical protein [Deltaproteobacteria bacterium]